MVCLKFFLVQYPNRKWHQTRVGQWISMQNNLRSDYRSYEKNSYTFCFSGTRALK